MSGGEVTRALVNAIIAITLVEGALLVLLHVLGRRVPSPAAVVSNVGAGLCLLGALRAVLDGSSWPACAAWLAGAGISHALDLWRRWPDPAATPLRPTVAPGSSVPIRSRRPT